MKHKERTMPDEAISCIREYMFDFDICKCCIIRLTNGRCQQIDLLNVFHSQAYPDEFICKLCFGLLHNPYLCDIPRNLNESQNEVEFTNEEFDKYILLYLYKELNGSHYQYTAYQLRVTEPINIMLREQFLWDELICMSTNHVNNNSNSSTIEKLNNLQTKFTKDDINALRSYAIPVKTAWKWIVDGKLSSLLKVPLIYSLRDDTELKLIKTNELNINNSNCDQESNIICLTIEFSNFLIQLDYDEFLSYLEHSPLNSIRSWLIRLKSVKIPRKRSKFHYGKELTTKTFSSQTLNYDKNSLIINPSSVINIGYTLPNLLHFSRGLLTELIPLLKDNSLQSNYLKKISSSNCSLAFITSLKIFRSIPLYLAGRYVKLSRRLPQSPWIIGSQRKLDSSVEELITQLILPRFGANSQSCFITAGREDVDVRCLGLGRPFAIEISNYELLPSKITQQWSVNDKLAVECNENEPLDLLKLASFVNSTTQGRVFIRDLQSDIYYQCMEYSRRKCTV
ncbi:putative tRNA pseudouridine synthase Pus10 [Schistosoma haematobium]|uniref:tRNA pseudouridine(55) synthase n=1 Tax=Schistosoma haematobium TaxID=6185 RepID=A0A922IMF5_SCHHA|nr:putative tRNA pseudouridine synthase Pus10 [Schistosoma haematobium]KAH9582744.1 putative tRNA pseudouridine synthase Pus10 [Schistosoma haematobium]